MTTSAVAPSPTAALVEDARPLAASVARRRRRRPRVLVNALAGLFCLVWAFPVYWMVNSAFKPRDELLSTTPSFVPPTPTLDNFGRAIGQPGFVTNLGNSLLVVGVTVVAAILLGLLAAAALSRFRFRGRRSILVAVLVVQMLPDVALLIPMFLALNQAGLVGTYGGLILVYVAKVLPFSIWVMRGFFLALPVEMEEAAALDGATRWQTLTKVLFPLVTPGIIATSTFAFIAAWNDYLYAYTLMKDESMYTLPVWLASFSTPGLGTDFGGQMAASTLFALPVVVFFLLVQRNLVAGMSAGAVKG